MIFDSDDAVFAVIHSPVSTRRRRARLQRLRYAVEARLTKAELQVVEARSTLELIDRELASYDAA